MTPQPPIEIAESRRGEWAVLHVRGDLDMGTTPDFEAGLASGPGPVAVELSGVGFIDSTGLRGLIRCRESRERCVLVAPSAVVRRLLVLTRLADSFDIVATLDDLDAPG